MKHPQSKKRWICLILGHHWTFQKSKVLGRDIRVLNICGRCLYRHIHIMSDSMEDEANY